MALLSLAKQFRMIQYECVDLLPDLEEDILFVDTTIPDLEESFVSGLDDWWGDFVSDMCL